MKFKKYDDPSHGWLKVKRSQLEKLGIAEQITYSYQRGEWVYLEEDCALPIFCNAMEEAGKTVEMTTAHTNNYSKIRNYSSYEYYTDEQKVELKELCDKILTSQRWSKAAINKIKNGSLNDMLYWYRLYVNRDYKKDIA